VVVPKIVVSGSTVEGNTLKVVISLVNNPGISSLKFDVLYDDILCLESIDFADGLGDYVTSPEPYINPQTVNWISTDEGLYTDGEFVTITFSIDAEIVKNTTAEIRIIPDNTNIFDTEMNAVKFKPFSTVVSISE
jgi:hypothetical protein